jgi:hypothetical protein
VELGLRSLLNQGLTSADHTGSGSRTGARFNLISLPADVTPVGGATQGPGLRPLVQKILFSVEVTKTLRAKTTTLNCKHMVSLNSQERENASGKGSSVYIDSVGRMSGLETGYIGLHFCERAR